MVEIVIWMAVEAAMGDRCAMRDAGVETAEMVVETTVPGSETMAPVPPVVFVRPKATGIDAETRKGKRWRVGIGVSSVGIRRAVTWPVVGAARIASAAGQRR